MYREHTKPRNLSERVDREDRETDSEKKKETTVFTTVHDGSRRATTGILNWMCATVRQPA